jgi:SAM-dependent methyltransferase
MTSINHYKKKYFNWQSKVGKFGAIANQIKFIDYIKDGQKVLDFGCGGGYMLSTFTYIKKYGVEINSNAKKIAQKNGLKIFSKSKQLPSNFFDLVISNNALEHTDNPLFELKELNRSLKKNGKICVIVPLDSIRYKYKKNDKDFHLFSWSPMNLGNLMTAAGFKVIESKPFIHKWFPFHQTIKKFITWKLFHFFCRIYGRMDNKWVQIRALATK